MSADSVVVPRGAAPTTPANHVRLAALRIEKRVEPLGVDVAPRISWIVESAVPGLTVGAVEVEVRHGDRAVWAYAGPPPELPEVECPLEALVSDTRYDVGVRVRTSAGEAVGGTWFRTGVLDGDWRGARWMGEPQDGGASPVFTGAFHLDKAPRTARLYLAAGGYAHVTVNGRPAADEVLVPGITAAHRRVPTVVWEVAPLLTAGRNVVRVEVGRGFYAVSEPDVWEWHRAPWTAPRSVLVRLTVGEGDDAVTPLVSGPAFDVAPGPTLYDDIYGGESFDARRTRATEPGVPAVVVAGPSGRRENRRQPPTRVIESIVPTVLAQHGDRILLDVGRVIAGWLQVDVAPPPGHRVTIRLSERLGGDGRPDVRDRRGHYNGRFQEDVLIGDGDPVTWEPRFTWKGFRYAEVSGWPAEAVAGPGSFRARVVHDDVARTGSFVCSDPTLTGLHDIAVATLLNNLHSIPTDTPMYEKNGWTADGMLAAEMLLLNLDTHALLAKWVDDIADSRDEHGIPHVIAPHGGWSHDWSPAPPWHAAYPLVPWTLYRLGGNRRVLAEHVEGILAYAEAEFARSADGIATTTLGDWVTPETSPDGGNPPEDPRIPATAYLHLAARVAGDICTVLGRTADAQRMSALADRVGVAFRREFLDADAAVVRGVGDAGYRQSHNLLALAFGLVPEPLERRIADGVAADIRRRGTHLNTGALSTKQLLPVLTRHGHADLALELIRQRQFPSWAYWLDRGATTLWEHWHEDSRSRNHFFLGTFDDWLYGSVLGIEPLAPGFRELRVRPRFLRELEWASGHVTSPFGRVAVAWRRDGGRVSLEVAVPVGTTAELVLDAVRPEGVRVGGIPAREAAGVHRIRVGDDALHLGLGSGSYEIDAEFGTAPRATLRPEESGCPE